MVPRRLLERRVVIVPAVAALALDAPADLERTARTFVQGFLGVVTLDALSTSVDVTLREQLTAGAYAGLAAFAAQPVGASDSASSHPADVDPPQGDGGAVDTLSVSAS